MFIEMFSGEYAKENLIEFARICGYELEKFIICDDLGCIKISIKKPTTDKYSLTYSLFDYHIEEINGYVSMGTKENLPTIQKQWRKYLKSKFGNFYVSHYNDWLDHQKLPFEKGNRR